MSSFLHETEEMCSHSFKKPSDKSHRADHEHGRNHLIHKGFLIFIHDVQSVLSWLHCCAAIPRHSACHWCRGTSLASTSRAAKPPPGEELGMLNGEQGPWTLSAVSSLPPVQWVSSCSKGTQTPTDPHHICETFHTHNPSVLCFLHFPGLKGLSPLRQYFLSLILPCEPCLIAVFWLCLS